MSRAGPLLEPAIALISRHLVVEVAVGYVVELPCSFLTWIEGSIALSLNLADALCDVGGCNLNLQWYGPSASVALSLEVCYVSPAFLFTILMLTVPAEL